VLHPDWRRIATRAWSMWLGYIAGACGLAAELLPFLPYLDGVIAPSWLTRLTLLLGALALLARLIPQRTIAAAAPPAAPPYDDPFTGWGPPPPRGSCREAPAGWWCSRHAGHDGPCAAWPDSIKPDGELSA
jgi:hypothetical protein